MKHHTYLILLFFSWAAKFLETQSTFSLKAWKLSHNNLMKLTVNPRKERLTSTYFSENRKRNRFPWNYGAFSSKQDKAASFVGEKRRSKASHPLARFISAKNSPGHIITYQYGANDFVRNHPIVPKYKLFDEIALVLLENPKHANRHWSSNIEEKMMPDTSAPIFHNKIPVKMTGSNLKSKQAGTFKFGI